MSYPILRISVLQNVIDNLFALRAIVTVFVQ